MDQWSGWQRFNEILSLRLRSYFGLTVELTGFTRKIALFTITKYAYDIQHRIRNKVTDRFPCTLYFLVRLYLLYHYAWQLAHKRGVL